MTASIIAARATRPSVPPVARVTIRSAPKQEEFDDESPTEAQDEQLAREVVADLAGHDRLARAPRGSSEPITQPASMPVARIVPTKMTLAGFAPAKQSRANIAPSPPSKSDFLNEVSTSTEIADVDPALEPSVPSQPADFFSEAPSRTEIDESIENAIDRAWTFAEEEETAATPESATTVDAAPLAPLPPEEPRPKITFRQTQPLAIATPREPSVVPTPLPPIALATPVPIPPTEPAVEPVTKVLPARNSAPRIVSTTNPNLPVVAAPVRETSQRVVHVPPKSAALPPKAVLAPLAQNARPVEPAPQPPRRRSARLVAIIGSICLAFAGGAVAYWQISSMRSEDTAADAKKAHAVEAEAAKQLAALKAEQEARTKAEKDRLAAEQLAQQANAAAEQTRAELKTALEQSQKDRDKAEQLAITAKAAADAAKKAQDEANAANAKLKQLQAAEQARAKPPEDDKPAETPPSPTPTPMPTPPSPEAATPPP